MKLLTIAAAMAAIITLNTAQAEEGAQYQVRFDATWNNMLFRRRDPLLAIRSGTVAGFANATPVDPPS